MNAFKDVGSAFFLLVLLFSLYTGLFNSQSGKVEAPSKCREAYHVCDIRSSSGLVVLLGFCAPVLPPSCLAGPQC